MGIFTNFEVEPSVYQTPVIESPSNQETYRVNYLQEVLDKQTQLNQSLSNSVDHVNHMLAMSTSAQNNQFHQVLQELSKNHELTKIFQEALEKQASKNDLILERLAKLEENNMAIVQKMESGGMITEAILNQQSFQDAHLEKLASKMDHYELQSNELSLQLAKQGEIYEELTEKLELQEVFHNTVMERLDQQESLIQKISRELDHLRTVIFERTTHLVDKFESSLNKLVQPVQKYFIKPKENNEKETIDQ